MLYHFTCSHRRALIGKRGHLKPYKHPLLPELPAMIWLTTEADPVREDVGLTSTILDCDRLEHRYRVLSGEVIPWEQVKQKCNPAMVLMLEYGRKPATWYVAFKPVSVRLEARLIALREGAR